MRHRLAVLSGVLAWIAGWSGSQAEEAVKLSIAGPEETVFEWKKDRCEDWDIPDAPLRAFRNQTGKVVAFASNPRNHPLIGNVLSSIKPTCTVAFEQHKDPDPAKHNDAGWIASTWTNDGRTVQALIHSEYHANEHPGACRFSNGMSCWYNVILAATSTDGGLTFSTKASPVVVAGPAMTQDVEQGRHRGFFNPSNIISDGRYWYVLIHTTGGSGQKPGICLFRSADIADTTGWRGWDGNDFSVQGFDAYRPGGREPRGCEPVGRFPNTVGSIVRDRRSGLFIAVTHAGPASGDEGSIRYATSSDLIHWSELRMLVRHPTMWSKSCDTPVRYAYASLVGPDSEEPNFTEIRDGVGFLYMTRFHVENCKLGKDRDLVRVKVTLSYE